MQDLISFLFKSIVLGEEKITVSQVASPDMQSSVFEVTVPKEEIAKVIGKGGSVIKAVRLLVGIRAHKEGKRLQINLQETP